MANFLIEKAEHRKRYIRNYMKKRYNENPKHKEYMKNYLKNYKKKQDINILETLTASNAPKPEESEWDIDLK